MILVLKIIQILPDELAKLFKYKPANIWETKIVSKINLEECDKNKLEKFYSDIKSSERVSNFIKQKNLIIQNIFSILQKNSFCYNLTVKLKVRENFLKNIIFKQFMVKNGYNFY